MNYIKKFYTHKRKKLKAGDRVYFGTYPQNTDEPEPIMWRVLKVKDGKALMISEYCIDNKKYNEEPIAVTWETCTLRKWLNDSFLKKAFTAEEQKKIVRVRNNNPDNDLWNTEGGNPTDDYVYCLSTEEAFDFFRNDRDRKAQATAYAKKNGAAPSFKNRYCNWWFRSPGASKRSADGTNADGGVNLVGFTVRASSVSVRPVITVTL